jgi:hypothetical protein
MMSPGRGLFSMYNTHMKPKKLLPKDKKLLAWLKKGGRTDAKKDFLSLVKRVSQPSKASPK